MTLTNKARQSIFIPKNWVNSPLLFDDDIMTSYNNIMNIL